MFVYIVWCDVLSLIIQKPIYARACMRATHPTPACPYPLATLSLKQISYWASIFTFVKVKFDFQKLLSWVWGKTNVARQNIHSWTLEHDQLGQKRYHTQQDANARTTITKQYDLILSPRVEFSFVLYLCNLPFHLILICVNFVHSKSKASKIKVKLNSCFCPFLVCVVSLSVLLSVWHGRFHGRD